MPGTSETSYTCDRRIVADGTVHFACSADQTAWPWLALPPDHPVPIMSQNYWSSVECLAQLGGYDRDKWSALVWTDWVCGEPGVGHAARGTFEQTAAGAERSFATSLDDAEGRLVVRMRGRGVVFRTRDFPAWREGSKREAHNQEDHGEFVFAPRAVLGLGDDERPFLAMASEAGTLALVTRDNGFFPGHRYIGGSGDHVNTTHIAEVGRQFLVQRLGGAMVRITGGEMALNRYIEIGTPFLLECVAHEEGELSIAIGQLGRPCADVKLRYATS